jgi:hypothetical protein
VKVGASFLTRTRTCPAALPFAVGSVRCRYCNHCTVLGFRFVTSSLDNWNDLSPCARSARVRVRRLSSAPSFSEVCRSVSLAKGGLDPTQAKRCQVSSSCPSEPLHATCACLDNALHVFSRGPSHGGTCTRSVQLLVVHVLAASSRLRICQCLSNRQSH